MSKRSRKKISSSDLIQVLQVVGKESYLEKTATSSKFDFTLANPFLRKQGLDSHIIYRRLGKKFPLNSERNVYDYIQNIIIRNLNIKLNDNFTGGKHSGWEPTSSAKWHFEECRFEPRSPNTGDLNFPWSGSFRFYKNEFDFGCDSGGMRSWLFVFASGSRVLFQRNDFKNSSMQIVYTLSEQDSGVQKLSWEGREAYIVRDGSYNEAMIRKTHRLPEAVRLNIPDAYSGHVGLHSLSFLGNKGIDHLHLRCNAASYVFSGMNCINHLSFNEFHSNFQDLDVKIYFGSRERIDPYSHNSFHHRSLFLSVKDCAVKRQDARLVNALDKQLDRIEYFLTKEQEVSFRVDRSEWFEYWQDRILYAWRRWSSDFYRSWLRPLSMVIVGYGALNAFPWFWVESFTFSDWLTFSLRPINKIPFYTESLEIMCGAEYENLSLGSKNWLRFIGLFQMVWIAIWSFAFSKSIKR